MERPSGVNALLRHLPPVDKLVQLAGKGTELPRWSLLAAARETLAGARRAAVDGIDAGEQGAGVAADIDVDSLVRATLALARRLSTPWPQRVINATGIVLHTNLGRAPLAPAAAAEVAHVSAGYSDLEIDLATGGRGSRTDRVAELLRLLSEAEAAFVVNNTAAALLLAVEALAADREVVLSRGELIEIGGSFRVPEIMASTRARLREIGTTNRTHSEDYESAIGEHTGMLLKVHRSNFSIEGFTREVSVAELVEIGRAHDVPVVEDRGSGSFLDLREHGVPEAPAWDALRAGADLVLFSGDKLLGGPQAGIVLGRRELVERMRRHPLARALRVDKMTLAALHWTLRALLDAREREIPVVGMLLAPIGEIAARAERLAERLRADGWDAAIERVACSVGGGALPELELPSAVVRMTCRSAERGKRRNPNDLASELRTGEPPVLARVHRDALQLDARTLADEDLEPLVGALRKLAR